MTNRGVRAGLGRVLGRTAWTAAERAPDRFGRSVATALADAATARDGAGVRRLAANLAVARPELTESQLRGLVRSGMRSYARYFAEICRIPRWSGEQIDTRVRVDNLAEFDAAWREGRGLVAALPHMGNYDLAGAWACRHGYPVTTVAERLADPVAYARFVSARARLGMEVLPLDTPGLSGTLIERVRAPRFVPLIADRDLTGSGVPVTMFGRAVRIAAGPAVLARRAKAPLVVVTTHYEGDTLVLRIHPRIEPAGTAQMSQQVADAFAVGIADHPQDWHMLQPFFDPADLGER